MSAKPRSVVHNLDGTIYVDVRIPVITIDEIERLASRKLTHSEAYEAQNRATAAMLESLDASDFIQTSLAKIAKDGATTYLKSIGAC